MTNWSGDLRGSDIRALSFDRARGSRAYDMQSVDAFLDRAAAALDGTGAPLVATEVQGVAFRRPPLGKHGYVMGQVDDALDRIEQGCRQRFG